MNRILPFFILAYLFIFAVLLNHENAWMHPEVANTTEAALKNNPTLSGRLAQALNWEIFEGNYNGIPNCRPRILSHIFQTINIILRNWVFRFFPPHPSLSLTWIFALILSPLFLYKLILNLTGSRMSAALSSLLYLVLPGNLIPVIMLFHPGKVLINFFFIFLLYRASCLSNDLPSAPAQFQKKFLPLALWLFVALLFDEYALFLFVLIPLFFPALFAGPRKYFSVTAWAATAAVFAALILSLLPLLYNFAGHPGFNVLSYVDRTSRFPLLGFATAPLNFFLMLHDNLGAGLSAYLRDESISVKTTAFMSFSNTLTNADNIRLGLSVLNDKVVTPRKIFHTIVVFVFAAAAIKAFCRARSEEDEKINGLVVRSLAGLVLFALYFSFVHIASNILSGCGWYGSPFSVLFAVAVGLIIHAVLTRLPKIRWLAFVFAASLAISSLWNVQLLNYAWLSLHHRMHYWELDMWLGKYPKEGFFRKFYMRKPKNNYTIAVKAWKNRSKPLILNSLPANTAQELRNYLIHELPYIP